MAYIPRIVVLSARTTNDVLSRGNYTWCLFGLNYLTFNKPVKLERLVSINGAVLVVYYISDRCYQYEILFWDGSIYQPQEVYETVDKALNIGIDSIKTVIGY